VLETGVIRAFAVFTPLAALSCSCTLDCGRVPTTTLSTGVLVYMLDRYVIVDCLLHYSAECSPYKESLVSSVVKTDSQSMLEM